MLGKIPCHLEAIMLAAAPPDALTPIREAALTATAQATGTDGGAGCGLAVARKG